MKKSSLQTLKPILKWQIGDYNRLGSFKFILPYPFLLLCRLVDKTTEEMFKDFANHLSCGYWKPEGKEHAREHLINYFMAHS